MFLDLGNIRFPEGKQKPSLSFFPSKSVLVLISPWQATEMVTSLPFHEVYMTFKKNLSLGLFFSLTKRSSRETFWLNISFSQFVSN